MTSPTQPFDALSERIAVAPVSLAESREQRMRQSIEAARGTAYTDFEWGEAKSNLVAFFGLLAELDLKYSEGHR